MMKTMNKRLTHPMDAAKWVEKVIVSCKTVDQVITAERLIQNFTNQYKHVEFEILHLLTVRLWEISNEKYKEIFSEKFLDVTKE